MNSSVSPLEKLQSFLKETLFQSDVAELDFGIYRILNYKSPFPMRFISLAIY